MIMTIDIKVKKLNKLAKLPTRGSKYAAGYDLYAATT
jgi:dUTPase